MAQSPIKNVCLLCEEQSSGLPIFLGSCFAFHSRTSLLTAAHCVARLHASQLLVQNPRNSAASRVASISLHPSADLAVIQLRSDGEKAVTLAAPCTEITKIKGIGGEYCAYGYPEDSIGPNAGVPVPRIFRGYGQRVLRHRSHMPYSYQALELSFPCPAGLSGGPLFKPKTFQLLGLITENIETTTSLHEETVTTENGKEVINHYRSVINYGLGLLLHDYNDWLAKAVVAPNI
ncbi:serine protease [Polaromonas sp. P1(28)-13]|nr:serine protease [Polaromonas sp. P1(28)-13]